MNTAALRVGLVCGELEPARDGVADYTLQLASALREVGCQPFILTTHRHAKAIGEPAIGVTARWTWRGASQAGRAIRRLALDVTHVQFAPSVYDFSRAVGILPMFLASASPLVVTLHEYGVWRATGVGGALRSRAWSFVERRGWLDRESLLLPPQCRCIIVTNPHHQAIVRQRWPTLNDRVVEIPIGSNVTRAPIARDHARRAIRERLGAGPAAPVIVFFGFLHPVKRLTGLIEAAASLRAEYPDAHVVIMGGGESHSVTHAEAAHLRERLLGAAARLGIADRVRMTGYLPAEEVSRMLLAADAAVFPFDDGVTLKSSSLLAALEHELPTIATWPDQHDASATDAVLWIPPHDTPAIERALRRVLGDSALAMRLRQAGLALIARRRWSQIAAQHMSAYQRVLAQAKR